MTNYYLLLKTRNLEQLTLTTPALLFSAISFNLLAYTKRFLAYALASEICILRSKIIRTLCFWADLESFFSAFKTGN